MDNYIITIDQSTSGTKVLLINEQAQIVDKLQAAHEQIYPQPGWVEHNPHEIYNTVVHLLNTIVEKHQLNKSNIHGLAITNQRETCLLWDKNGEALHHAIVWQCNRTASLCQQYIENGYEKFIEEKTGLKISPYFSATKLIWLNMNCEKPETTLAGTMDSWLIYKLTNHQVHATDYTNACRTLLFNIHSLQWDEELLKLFQLQQIQLPHVHYSDSCFGTLADPKLSKHLQGVAIYGVIGDSQAALFSQCCFQKGDAKATLGTGTSVLMNVGTKPIATKDGIVSTIAWALSKDISYAIEGIIYSTGDTISWAKEQLNLFSNYDELHQLLQKTFDAKGVIIIPAFHGLGAPYWSQHAKAAIFGISRSTSKAHILKACVDSIALQINDVLHLMEILSNEPLRQLKCDGGGTNNRFTIQQIANILQKNVDVNISTDLSPIGAAFICGLAIDWWQKDTLKNFGMYSSYQPIIDNEKAQLSIAHWQNLVKHLQTIYD
ncbi:MAG: glycerol kinase GlpK [Lysinibacillus sp.]